MVRDAGFTIKGGVALELRLRHLARTTRDLHLTLMAASGDLVQELGLALAQPYEGFSFRVRGEPGFMPNGAARVEVSLQYLGKSWGTIPVDIGPREGATTDVEMVEAISLAPFGLEGPETLPCSSLPYHVAQKIHAMTLPEEEGRRNDRYRDLIDLLLLREWVTDLEGVRRACREVFETRGTHSWPPLFVPPERWTDPFARMAEDVGLDNSDVFDAACEVRKFLVELDPTADWLPEISLSQDHSVTTWYFLGTGEGELRRVSAPIGEAFHTCRWHDLSPAEEQFVAAAVVLIGVTLFLRERRPVYVQSVSIASIDSGWTDEDADVWHLVAAELLRNARAPKRALTGLAEHLATHRQKDPAELAPVFGVSGRQAREWRLSSHNEQILWDLTAARPVRRALTDALRSVPRAAQ